MYVLFGWENPDTLDFSMHLTFVLCMLLIGDS